MTRRITLLSIVFWSVAAGAARADDATQLDWSAWQRMPVFDHGRLMPLDSFARSVVRKICGSPRPTLDPFGIPKTSRARQLFPDDRPRKFDAAELLFSWMVEPEKWEQVPLLIAADGELREVFLQLPLENNQGRGLEHVSCHQLLGAARFRERLDQLRQQQRWAGADGRNLKFMGVDKKISELYEAYELYRLVTFNPAAPADTRSRFFEKLAAAVHTWRDLERGLRGLPQPPDEPGSGLAIEDVTEAEGKLLRLIRQDGFTLEEADPLLAEFRRSAERLAKQVDAVCRGAFRDETTDDRQRAAINELAVKTVELARVADEMHMALYDNGRSLRLAPALSPAALRADRDLDDDNQPWLGLQTLLLGSDALLEKYPEAELAGVRRAFAQVKAAYLDRGASDRPQRFAEAMARFAAAVRTLGEKIEPLRQKLPIPGEKQDIKEMLAATAYPPEGYTDIELHYNRVDPFRWSSVVYLLSTVCLLLSFVLARRPMFWIGISALILGQVLIIYGLTLRTVITGWVSVTNMFEVTMFVGLTAGVLGLWFTLLPLLRLGVTRAFRMPAPAPTSPPGGGLAETLEDVFRHRPHAAVGAVAGLVALLVAYFVPIFDKDIRPLMPILRDNFWLTVHVLSITASYGAAALAWGLGNIALGYYLFGRYRDPDAPVAPPGSGPDGPAEVHPAAPVVTARRPPEACAALARFIYKPIQVAVLLLAIGTILGALWADVAWGRFWSWDSKEVWALIALLVYTWFLHARRDGWVGNFGLALASVAGITSVLMAWYGVNYLLRSGMHTYAGGAGGLFYVLTVVLCQWLFLLAAAIRYLIETCGKAAGR